MKAVYRDVLQKSVFLWTDAHVFSKAMSDVDGADSVKYGPTH